METCQASVVHRGEQHRSGPEIRRVQPANPFPRWIAKWRSPRRRIPVRDWLPDVRESRSRRVGTGHGGGMAARRSAAWIFRDGMPGSGSCPRVDRAPGSPTRAAGATPGGLDREERGARWGRRRRHFHTPRGGFSSLAPGADGRNLADRWSGEADIPPRGSQGSANCPGQAAVWSLRIPREPTCGSHVEPRPLGRPPGRAPYAQLGYRAVDSSALSPGGAP